MKLVSRKQYDEYLGLKLFKLRANESRYFCKKHKPIIDTVLKYADCKISTTGEFLNEFKDSANRVDGDLALELEFLKNRNYKLEKENRALKQAIEIVKTTHDSENVKDLK